MVYIHSPSTTQQNDFTTSRIPQRMWASISSFLTRIWMNSSIFRSITSYILSIVMRILSLSVHRWFWFTVASVSLLFSSLMLVLAPRVAIILFVSTWTSALLYIGLTDAYSRIMQRIANYFTPEAVIHGGDLLDITFKYNGVIHHYYSYYSMRTRFRPATVYKDDIAIGRLTFRGPSYSSIKGCNIVEDE